MTPVFAFGDQLVQIALVFSTGNELIIVIVSVLYRRCFIAGNIVGLTNMVSGQFCFWGLITLDIY